MALVQVLLETPFISAHLEERANLGKQFQFHPRYSS